MHALRRRALGAVACQRAQHVAGTRPPGTLGRPAAAASPRRRRTGSSGAGGETQYSGSRALRRVEPAAGAVGHDRAAWASDSLNALQVGPEARQDRVQQARVAGHADTSRRCVSMPCASMPRGHRVELDPTGPDATDSCGTVGRSQVQPVSRARDLQICSAHRHAEHSSRVASARRVARAAAAARVRPRTRKHAGDACCRVLAHAVADDACPA
jgi:hypothetical protein